ncbi:MAG: tetratricopeptide repeat protein [Gemmataceae bacterium]
MSVMLMLGLLVLSAEPGKPTTAAEWYAQGNEQMGQRKFDDAVRSFTRCLELDANHLQARDGRGSAYFMVGKFKESVADFDRTIAARPELANGHWRRGISLYYAGKYDEGKKQFEGYEKVDTNDVENAVWHFLCAARKDGLEKARAGMLNIGKDRRPVLMEIYDLYRGKAKAEDVIRAANADSLTETQRQTGLFYAHLYLGILADLQGDPRKAQKHLQEAADKYRIRHYMGEVPRVHLLTLKPTREK